MTDRSLPANSPDTAEVAQPEDSSLPPVPPIMDITRLIHEHHRPLYGYAFRLCGSDADAQDLTQQTFMIAQQKIHQIRDPAKTRSWLFTVLRSCYFKSRRKKTPTPASTLELDVDHIPNDAAPDDHIDQQLLQLAIDELPDEFKVVVVMFYFEDCSYKEIAEKLDLPIGTVMSRLSRGKKRLRRRLLSTEVATG